MWTASRIDALFSALVKDQVTYIGVYEDRGQWKALQLFKTYQESTRGYRGLTKGLRTRPAKAERCTKGIGSINQWLSTIRGMTRDSSEAVHDVALHRALDNVLPHIAYRHFSNPSDALTSKTEGRWCFSRFVNSYINSDHMYALLPSAERFTGSPFITLWQSDSTLIKHAGHNDDPIDSEALWDRFLDSLSEYGARS